MTLKIEKSNERVSYVMGREGAKVPRKKRNARVEKSIMHDDDEYMNDSMKLSNYNDSFAGEEKRGKKKHEHKCETDCKARNRIKTRKKERNKKRTVRKRMKVYSQS